MLGQLIWKDLRICRWPLIAACFMLMIAYVLGYLVISSPVAQAVGYEHGMVWAFRLSFSGLYAVMAAHVSLAILAGSLIAGERASGTSQFLDTLPVSRRMILGSKLTVLATCAAVGSLASWGVVWVAQGMQATWLVPRGIAMDGFNAMLPPVAAFGVAAVGAGWLASVLLRSAGQAVGIAIATPLAIGFLIIPSMRQYLGTPSPNDSMLVFQAICWTVGIGTFAAGNVWFLTQSKYS